MEVVTILITGASGNIGKEVLKQIAQTGAQVRAAWSRNRYRRLQPAGDSASSAEGRGSSFPRGAANLATSRA